MTLVTHLVWEKTETQNRKVALQYRENLKNINGIRFMDDIEGLKHNYPYFPIFVSQREYGKSRDELYEELKKNNIYGRRYFYPLISHFPIYRGLDSARSSNLPIAEKIAKGVYLPADLPLFKRE